jgi:outer membrane translocation and assembly module TamA
MGLIILAGLPNSTSVQQETDALYGSFKSATYDRAEHVLMEKIKERGQQVRRRQGDGPFPPKGAPSSILLLGFHDLATIVDGNKDDDLSMKPFTKNFTREKIVNAWAKIGFVPFTRNCLNDKKVRHELGQADVNTVIETLHAKYVNLVAVVEDQGLNQGVFDASISVAVRLERSVDEDEQVRQLLAQKGAFSASALWNVCGTRVGNARVALRAQREQIAIDAAKVTLQTQGRLEQHAEAFNQCAGSSGKV